MLNRVKYKYAGIAILLVAWYKKFVLIKTLTSRLRRPRDESVRAFYSNLVLDVVQWIRLNVRHRKLLDNLTATTHA